MNSLPDDIAIRVTDVSKSFRLPHEKHTSIKGAVVGLFNSNKLYEKQTVLNNISFEIKKGEFFGIVGRNGSGKSTLLKLLAGIYTPDEGAISINGKLTPFIELGVGFNHELTGRENVFLNGALLGFNRSEMDKMYEEIVKFAELEKFMDQKLKNYSSGMQVRLAFSIAVQAKSDILLLDEVLAVGDINFQKKCFRYFRSLKEENRTVVFVSHDMGAIREYCDNGILIDESRQIPTKNFTEVVQKYISLMKPKEKKLDDQEIKKSKIQKGDFNISNAAVKLDDQEITLSYKLSFPNATPGKEFHTAFSVKNNLEQKVYGTSTQIYSKPMIIGSKKSFNICWTMANVLSKGEYSFNVTTFNKDKTSQTTFEDVVSFSNEKPLENHFSVNPVKELKIN